MRSAACRGSTTATWAARRGPLRAESTDRGRTWSPPVRTYQDVDAAGAETFWGFWRYTKRTYRKAGKRRRTLFATGYQDFDTAVGLFASDDGITWEKRSTIIASYDDVPSEAELQFFGKNHEIAVALVRLDNQDILADGQTAICTSHEPFVSWECGRRIEQRLDGPTWVVRRANGTHAQLRVRTQAPAVHVQAHRRLRAARRPDRPWRSRSRCASSRS